ncbi:dockerin type I repeat-containing protein [Ruminococcus sp.]
MDSDAEWTTNENTIYGNSAMIFLTAAIMSKNDQTVEGDVNADGVFDLSDLVMLQKWLLGDGTLTNWNAGDLQKDGNLNGYDLCIMRNRLAEE